MFPYFRGGGGGGGGEKVFLKKKKKKKKNNFFFFKRGGGGGGGGGVASVWWAGSFEFPAQAKLAVVLTIASTADFCGACGCARVAMSQHP